MNVIKECMNQYIDTYNERGNIVRNIHNFKIIHVDKQTIVCQNCKHRFKIDDDDCPICSAFNESYIIGKIESKCKNESFVIQTKKKIKSPDIIEIYKLKIDYIFGTMSCIVRFEENDWSSTPFNYFETTIYLFRNRKNRDKFFDNLALTIK
uniref:Uncharacterized protein n=1 Tax=viral metagenome TaxID=1070528 RepID=A0A6C0C9H1_9ZZZZ